MKKLLVFFLFLFILSGCGAAADTGAGVRDNIFPGSLSDARPGSGTAEAVVDGSVAIDAAGISRISVKDILAERQRDYSDPVLIKEFCSLLENHRYTGIEKISGGSYSVEFFGLNGKSVLTLAFNDNTVYTGRDITIGKTELAEGAYEADGWSWVSFSFFLSQLDMGIVMDPEYVQYPAKLKVPDEYYELRLVDRGDERINNYDVYPMLYDFMKASFIGREVEVVSGKKYYAYEAVQAEIEKTSKESRCIVIAYGTSDTRFEITSRNSYKSGYKPFILGYCPILAKIPDQPGMYKLIADRVILQLRMGSDFDEGFEALFSKNGKTYKEVSPEEIKSLFDGKKPNYLEYICKNLGIGEWTGNKPDRLEIKEMKLDSRSKPYTVVNIYNPFDLRMLFYKRNNDGTAGFVGDIGFGGRVAGTEYRLEKAGDRVWIAGNRCRGYGTGISLYYREWYLVTDNGIKLSLGYPYDTHEDGPHGGYSVNAGKVGVQKTDGLKIKVDYDIARRYSIFLSIADECGSVELKGAKTAEFAWDEEQEKFVSSYATDETGAFDIPAESPEITRKCDALLNEYYDELLQNIHSLGQDESGQGGHERYWKAEGIRTFLNDCTDSAKKAKLLELLTEVGP